MTGEACTLAATKADTAGLAPVGRYPGGKHQWQPTSRGCGAQWRAARKHIHSRGGGSCKSQRSSERPCLMSARNAHQRCLWKHLIIEPPNHLSGHSCALKSIPACLTPLVKQRSTGQACCETAHHAYKKLKDGKQGVGSGCAAWAASARHLWHGMQGQAWMPRQLRG